MIYIITALKSEAQAFVDKYKLDSSKSNNHITIIISGIGRDKMFLASQKVVTILKECDIIVNIGICAADRKFKIGELLPQDILLTCVDEPIKTQDKYLAVDMESAGFLDATHQITNTYMFKIVSDHFEPDKVTKDKTKQLIFEKIDTIMEIINA